jgi:hypothetical protein
MLTLFMVSFVKYATTIMVICSQNIKQKMAAARNVYLAFGLRAITNGLVEPGLRLLLTKIKLCLQTKKHKPGVVGFF